MVTIGKYSINGYKITNIFNIDVLQYIHKLSNLYNLYLLCLTKPNLHL